MLPVHGRQEWYQDSYENTVMKKWVQELKKSRVREAWIYFNNDVNAHAPENAKRLIDLFNHIYRTQNVT